MKTKIFLLSILMIFFFSIKNYSQIEIDTSKYGPLQQNPTVEDLKDSLSPYGQWVKTLDNEIDVENSIDNEDSAVVDNDIYTGYIFVPNPAIYIDWNPYSCGRWIWTYWGWEWVSCYDWCWSTYHYGRWWYSDNWGWVWSPGHRWRHNWVSWHRHGNYWGWHPLPPRIHYKSGIPVINSNEKHNGWIFVEKQNFTKTVDKNTIVDKTKYTEILTNSKENTTIKTKMGVPNKINISIPNKTTTNQKPTIKNKEVPKNNNEYKPNNKVKSVPKNNNEHKSNNNVKSAPKSSNKGSTKKK